MPWLPLGPFARTPFPLWRVTSAGAEFLLCAFADEGGFSFFDFGVPATTLGTTRIEVGAGGGN
jgi:hypothetical protein